MVKRLERLPPIFEGNLVRFDISTHAHPDTWAVVDLADWPLIAGIRWSATKRQNGLYVRNATVGLLHRFLLQAPDGLVVDHRDGEPLNNVRLNIRVCTQALNNQARFDRERGYALITERVAVETLPHVVKMKLATGEVREYVYPTRAKKRTKPSLVCKILPAR